MLLPMLGLMFASSQAVLLQIGEPDGTPKGFGLYPGGYAQYQSDSVYLAGISKPSDWNYVLPGNYDNWAKSRQHSGEIYFRLNSEPESDLVLTIRLSESHPSSPPSLRLLLNDKRESDWQPPTGNSDDVVLGKAESGKTSEWMVTLPRADLKKDNNVLTIQNLSGSWVVFDSITLEGPEGTQLGEVMRELRISAAAQKQAVLKTPDGPKQPLSMSITNIGPAAGANIGGDSWTMKTDLQPGRQIVEVMRPPVKSAYQETIRVQTGYVLERQKVTLQPVRPWTIYVMPHSHVDIGYTGLQTDVLKMHERNFLDALTVAGESKSNPKDSKFKFNTEATWVLDRFLQEAPPEQKEAVIKALRDGKLGISGSYANLLTGVMNPEELMQSYRYSRILQDKLGINIDTASQTDVPGMTWGAVTAMYEAGIKYVVLMPNNIDRIGGVRIAHEDQPFYWKGPSSRERVLVWQTDPYSVGTSAGWNGDRSQIYRTNHPEDRFIGSFIFEKLNRLIEKQYPYDIVAEPWSFVDNAPVDADVPRAAKAWNEKYVYPHVVLSTFSEACHELERRYRSIIPEVSGDYTPYWEDGVGSSAFETAQNRSSAHRLIQAETLFAMQTPAQYPAAGFLEAWRNVILYSEHTWGAWNSISEPESDFVKGQWAIKSGFAHRADAMSKALLDRSTAAKAEDGIDVINTSSWPRTDLVLIPAGLSKGGDMVVDAAHNAYSAQRLKTGELAVLAQNVPSFGSVRLFIRPNSFVASHVSVTGNKLVSHASRVEIDPASGSFAVLDGSNRQIMEPGTNQFFYLVGDQPSALQKNSNVKVETIESGPLVGIVRVSSTAPGTAGVEQEVRLVGGLNRVDITNTIYKLAVREKEAVHFAFPFMVPNGQIQIGSAWARVRPELDQMSGANKNWMTSQEYVDDSNQEFGVTWVSQDAPLIEMGEISAILLGSQTDPLRWRQHIDPAHTIYSWALNNHWHTNYLAEQSGTLTFRYSLQAHGPFDAAAASRFAREVQQPLLVRPASGSVLKSLLTVSDPAVLVTRLVPSDDGRALIVRLWNPGDSVRQVALNWREGVKLKLFRSDVSQKALKGIRGEIQVPARGVVTLRAEK